MDYVLQEDGSLKESVGLIQSRLAAMLKPLGEDLSQVPRLKESPVADVLLQNELLFVNYDYLPQLIAHLKHALLQWGKRRLIQGKSLDWLMTDPRSIVDAAFGSSEKYGGADPNPVYMRGLITTPLLVVRAASFIKFRGPQEQISYVLRLREDANRPTLFCYPSSITLFATDSNQNDADMVRLKDSATEVALTRAEFAAEVAHPKRKR